MSAMEIAHVCFLEEFFLEKRRQIDELVQMARSEGMGSAVRGRVFGDPRVHAVWKEVVKSSNSNDRLQFIASVGPMIQEKISRKRVELIQPLDELERTIKAKLALEYDQFRAGAT